MRALRRHLRHAGLAMALGAVLEYFVDPDLGADRRRRAVGSMSGWVDVLGSPRDGRPSDPADVEPATTRPTRLSPAAGAW